MKKLILAITLLLTATSAMAQYHGGYRGGYSHHGPVVVNRYYGHGGGCYGCGVGAAIIGGAILGAAISTPHYYTPPPVYMAPPLYVAPPSVPYGYHHQQIFDGACNCYRTVLVPN